MSDQPLVSVIVPVYNVEAYLEHCLDSLLAQTLSDFEIICINDGSTDASPAILESYAQKDSRIQIINQKNVGLAASRDVGLNAARGKYISFVDSDDYVLPDFLSAPVSLATKHNADLVLFDTYVLDTESKEMSINPWMLRTEKLPESMPFSYGDTPNSILQIALPSVCTKLFSSELISAHTQLAFGSFRLAEDLPFSYTAMLLAERIVALDEQLYVYRWMRAGSLTESSSDPQRFYAPFKKLYDNLTEIDVLNQIETSYLQRTVDGITFELSKLAKGKVVNSAISFLNDGALANIGLTTQMNNGASRSQHVFADFDPADYLRYQELSLSDEVDVIVPICSNENYNHAFIEGILKSKRRFKLTIIDNTELSEVSDELLKLVESLPQSPKRIVSIHSNKHTMSIAACVNTAARNSSNHIVVVLPGSTCNDGWLERIVLPLYSDKAIATASPCSNVGMVGKLPSWWLNRMNQAIQGEALSEVFAKLIPTAPAVLGASSSCVAISRRALNKVGEFSEEIDFENTIMEKSWQESLFKWCLKARELGFRDSLAESLYVHNDFENEPWRTACIDYDASSDELLKIFKETDPIPEIMKRVEARLDLESLLNSKSWRLTQPLRDFSERVNQ